MKKATVIALLSTCYLCAQEPTHSVSATKYMQMKEMELGKAQADAVAAKGAQSGISEIMIISPEKRAKDFENAFHYLKKMNSAAKVAVKLKDGSSIAGILGMEVMPGGTMIIFQTNTIQGIKYHVENIENIESIGDV